MSCLIIFIQSVSPLQSQTSIQAPPTQIQPLKFTPPTLLTALLAYRGRHAYVVPG